MGGGEGEEGGSPAEDQRGEKRRAAKERRAVRNIRNETETVVDPLLPGVGPVVKSAVSGDDDTEQRLLSLTSKQWKRLLVKPDSEVAWFEQSATTEPAFPVISKVLEHLSSVATELRKTEVKLYEQCKLLPICRECGLMCPNL